MSMKREKIAAKDVHMKMFSFHISERTQKSSEEEIDPFPIGAPQSPPEPHPFFWIAAGPQIIITCLILLNLHTKPEFTPGS